MSKLFEELSEAIEAYARACGAEGYNPCEGNMDEEVATGEKVKTLLAALRSRCEGLEAEAVVLAKKISLHLGECPVADGKVCDDNCAQCWREWAARNANLLEGEGNCERDRYTG